MHEIYRFNKNDYDEDGRNKSNGKLFSDTIREWELEFNKKFNPFFSNHIFANYSTMELLENCFVPTGTEDFGIDGQFDFETNLKIDKHNKRDLVYAIDSGINEDEPLFLIIDSKVSDGTVILKYIPENDDENNEPEIPVVEDENKKVLVKTKTVETIEKKSFLNSTKTIEFIEFLNTKFNKKDGINLQEQLDEYHWPKGKNGLNFEDTYTKLKNLRSKFEKTFSENDEQKADKQAFEICEDILHWGGVGVAKKNLNSINKLRKEKKFISTLQSARKIIKSDKIESDKILIPANSGFSKIYACLHNGFIIYDSRVAAMMCFLVKECFNENPFPLTLGKAAYQAKGNRDPGEEFPMLTGNDKKYLVSNIKASWILEKFAEQYPKPNYDTEKLIFAYQTTLFVLGKELPPVISMK